MSQTSNTSSDSSKVDIDSVEKLNYYKSLKPKHEMRAKHFTFICKECGKVNYRQPKGWQLVMLPVLPRETYSTIGRLTYGLPSRFSGCRRAAL